MPRLFVLILALGLAACGGEDEKANPDSGLTLDATPQANAPDGGAFLYPPGPYGAAVDDVIENLQWLGFVDDDKDKNPFDQEPRIFQLAEYFAQNDPTAKVIMINAAAGWCGPCQAEAYSSGELIDNYQAKGARFVSALFEDGNYDPVTREYTKSWGETFSARWPLMVDATFLLGKYFPETSMPMNMFVDAKTMKIITIYNGYSEDQQVLLLDYLTSM